MTVGEAVHAAHGVVLRVRGHRHSHRHSDKVAAAAAAAAIIDWIARAAPAVVLLDAGRNWRLVIIGCWLLYR